MIHRRHLCEPGRADDDGTPPHGHRTAGQPGRSAARDQRELQFIGQLDQFAHLFRVGGLHDHERKFHAQVGGVRGAGHQRARTGDNSVGRQEGAQALDQFLAEGDFRLMPAPEQGDAFAYGVRIMVRQGKHFPIEAFFHTRLDRG